MKNFLKNHPYWSSVGIALTLNSAMTAAILINDNDKSQTPIKLAKNCCSVFGFNIILSTLPAIASTAIDKFVHQKVFDNKPLQYILTATESEIMTPLFFSGTFWDLDAIEQYLTKLVSHSLNEDSIFSKSMFLNTMIQSCALKYISDLASEQPEIEVNNHSLDNPSLS